MDPSRISRYESGDDIPGPGSLARVLRAVRLRASLMAPIRAFMDLIRGSRCPGE